MEMIATEGDMEAYAPEVERMMKRLFDSLNDYNRRRYRRVQAVYDDVLDDLARSQSSLRNSVAHPHTEIRSTHFLVTFFCRR